MSNTLENTQRQSNLELLRIISMLMIIGHHYVVSSGVYLLFDVHKYPFNTLFLEFLGFGGKMAINVFVLISSYFMCQKRATWLKVLKLYLEIIFYAVVIHLCFVIAGEDVLLLKSGVKVLFRPFLEVGKEFPGTFLVFYMLIPFLNILLRNISKKQHQGLIILLLVVYTLNSTFFFNDFGSSDNFGWFIALFFMASYIQLYPNSLSFNRKVLMLTALISIFSIFAILVGMNYFGWKGYIYSFVTSEKLLALALSISLFLLFLNVNLEYNRFINTISASTFGVLLIHANNDVMRDFLWNDLLRVSFYYETSYLPLHFLLSNVAVFSVCTLIDYLRIRYIEKPLFSRLSKFERLKTECVINVEKPDFFSSNQLDREKWDNCNNVS